MIKTYTYKIKPNKVLEQKFEEQLGICRYVYNIAIEVREELKKFCKKEHLDFRLAKSNLMEVLTIFKRFETWWDNRVLEKI